MYIQETQQRRLILASRSASRQAILRGAGLNFEAAPADLDETSMLQTLEREGFSIADRAIALSKAKAEAVSRRIGDPAAIYIGSDQILDLDGAALESPNSREEAEERLKRLRGRRHDLVCGAAVYLGPQLLEGLVSRVSITMRDFSDRELGNYLRLVPDSDLFTVGAYALEGLGARLIDQLEGDWFAALGLPLWPVLKVLRRIADKEAS